MRILLFAGTSEGRILADRLANLPVDATVSVATEYGRDLLEGMAVLTGRLDAQAIIRLVKEEGFDLLIDATHPYADLATENIRTAAETTGVPLLRVSRGKSGSGDNDGDFVTVPSAAEAARCLAGIKGNVLLATGTKELSAFTVVPDFAKRLFPRVLPTCGAILECERLGFARSHIVAMQGPFTQEMNAALMRQLGIAVLVTKDGGAAGGFPGKIRAAEEVGAKAIVIARPESGGESGMGLEDVLAAVLSLLEAAK